jgi:DNA-directed RNA polymerases I, II, and III subunit RPABC2
MDSPVDYLSDADESLNDEEYESGLEDVTNKLTAKKEKPLKLSVKDEGDEDDDDDDDDDDDIDEDDIIPDDDDIVPDEEDEVDDESSPIKLQTSMASDVNIDINLSDDDSDYDDSYYEKFDNELKQDYILKYHSNLLQNNYDEIETLTKITGLTKDGLNDAIHKTIPILTKYEKARVLGLRAKQLENGSLPLIELDKSIIDPYLIAVKELEQKQIPYIIKRPLPNGASEYWKLKDLELLLE